MLFKLIYILAKTKPLFLLNKIKYVSKSLKEPSSIFWKFQTFGSFATTKKKNSFSRKLWQILQLKMFRLEDFNDNVSGYGSHKQVYIVR